MAFWKSFTVKIPWNTFVKQPLLVLIVLFYQGYSLVQLPNGR
jgi:hypothetical protein